MNNWTSPPYWQDAIEYLKTSDPRIASLINQYPDLKLRSRGQAFETLARSIIGQQISVKAAEAVWGRFYDLCERMVTPAKILATPATELRTAGLSERKVIYIRDLAQHFADGHLQPQDWPHVEDEELIRLLTEVKGIGRWTAEMFLIFHLMRPNIFPRDDLGLQKAISLHYRYKYPVSKRNMDVLARKWKPYATVAVWFLWRSLDPVPVEY